MLTAIQATTERKQQTKVNQLSICQKVSVIIVFKEILIFYRQREDCAKNQAQNFIVREAEL